VGILSNGTSGNVNNNNYAATTVQRRQPYEKMRLVAEDVAQAVYAAYQKLQHRDAATLAMRQRELELAVRKPTPEQGAGAKELLSQPEGPDKFPHQRAFAQLVLKQHEAPPSIRVILQTLRIGELGIASIPFETFTDTGLELKAKSPLRPILTISLANGGYTATCPRRSNTSWAATRRGWASTRSRSPPAPGSLRLCWRCWAS